MVNQHEVTELASALGETRAGTMKKLAEVIHSLGVKRADVLFEKARQQFQKGGMNRKDGQGKRTLGGVFFALAKQAMSKRSAKSRLAEEPAPKCIQAAHLLERICRRANACREVMLNPKRNAAAGQVRLRECVQAITALTAGLAKLLPPIRSSRDELKPNGDNPREWLPPIGLSQAGPRGRKGYRPRWIGGGMSN